MQLTEDDLYRSSTQFRNWSFTASQLAAQRLKINVQATERVKANVARLRAQRGNDAVDNNGVDSGMDKENGSGTSGANTPDARMQTVTEINCLTAEEELKIVNEFCERAIALGNHYSFPLNVVVRLSLLPQTTVTLKEKATPTNTTPRQHASNSSAASTSTTHP